MTSTTMPDISVIAARALEHAGLPRVSLRPFTVGRSHAHVLHGGGVVVKLADAVHERVTLQSESEMFRWLKGRVLVPEVLWSGAVDTHTVLVMEELPGHPLYEHPSDRHQQGLVAIVHALAQLHGLPIAGCPFDQRLPIKIVQAGKNVEAGLVDETDFDDEHAGIPAAVLYEKVLATCPGDSAAPVVTHGDACIPNFVLSDVPGLVDLGRAGVGDRYQDFALFLRSAAFNFPALDARAILMREYPLAALDDTRLTFFRLLDEFF